MPFAGAVCLGAGFLVRRLPDSAALRRGPISMSLLAIRIAVSALTVLAVTSVAHVLGPKWSGLVVGFPVNGLPVMPLLHPPYRPPVTIPLILRLPLHASPLHI